jgi:hypothetical protein
MEVKYPMMPHSFHPWLETKSDTQAAEQNSPDDLLHKSLPVSKAQTSKASSPSTKAGPRSTLRWQEFNRIAMLLQDLLGPIGGAVINND